MMEELNRKLPRLLNEKYKVGDLITLLSGSLGTLQKKWFLKDGLPTQKLLKSIYKINRLGIE